MVILCLRKISSVVENMEKNMSDFTFSFNEEAAARLEAAAEAFELKDKETALALAFSLLSVATRAKKAGKDLAVIQDIRSGNRITSTLDELIDLKNTKGVPGKRKYTFSVQSLGPGL